MWIGCWGKREPSDSVRQVTIAACAFSLSRLRAPAPSRREPGITAARLHFATCSELLQGNGGRLPPGGSWQRACSLTEGERGSDKAVKLWECGLVSAAIRKPTGSAGGFFLSVLLGDLQPLGQHLLQAALAAVGKHQALQQDEEAQHGAGGDGLPPGVTQAGGGHDGLDGG